MLEKIIKQTKALKLSVASALAILGAVETTKAQDQWTATLEVKAKNASAQYSDSVQFGARTNATRLFDIGVDLIDPPPFPGGEGVNTFLKIYNSGKILMKNFISCNDSNRSFEGEIAYGSFAPTSTVVKVTGLPNNYVGAFLTYSNSTTWKHIKTFEIANGQEVEIGTNALGYVITEAPKINRISASKNQSNPSNRDVFLNAAFYARGLTNLDVYQSTNLNLGNFSKRNEKLVGTVQDSRGTEENYAGTLTNLPSKSSFFRIKVP